MSRPKQAATARDEAFRQAVVSADHLVWKAGLQAVKKAEGGGQITAKGTICLLGSANMDGDCRSTYPNSNRWDYVIGYRRASRVVVASFVEVHSANASGVTELGKKLTWLCNFLQKEPQAELAKLPREYHWVASGKIDIPQNTPHYRALTVNLPKRGLRGPVKHLTLA